MVYGELWGISADGWIAIATIFSGFAVLLSGVAVLYGIIRGARQFLGEQEAADVRRYLVENGAWRLKASLDRLLQTVRINYSTSMHLLRLARDLPVGTTGAPRVEDLPRLFPMNPSEFAFDAIRPASRVLNCQDLGALATKAFARLHSVHAILTAEVEHPHILRGQHFALRCPKRRTSQPAHGTDRGQVQRSGAVQRAAGLVGGRRPSRSRTQASQV